jgi:hypothetical protein
VILWKAASYAISTSLSFLTIRDAHNLPIFPGNPNEGAAGSPITVPSNTPITGGTMGWYQGRVYAPSATLDGHHDLTVVFAGYHTAKPKNGLGDYRTIGRVSLHSNKVIQDVSTNTGDDSEE